ncbi:MAG: NAD-dependent epimerase/dehydratase family protein [Flavobacteriales bacterium]|nr:NAD-dependent epimerase/dehydratase family protein [Flavobacteriales bacterium]
MAKVLITGGAGFIGSSLAKKLSELNFGVTVYDNLLRGNKLDKETLNNIEFVKGDVRDAAHLAECAKGCDVIIHFAAILGVDIVADNPIETMDVEAIGMRNVANAALECGVKKILYASTSGIYGHSAIEQAVSEEIIVDPRTSYAMAKRYNEIYLAALHEEKGIESVCLRFFNVYGKNQDNRMVIPRFFEQALANNPITVFGNGLQTRDFTYIDDTVDACIRLMEKSQGYNIVNIANEQEINIKYLAEQILDLTASTSEIKYIEAPIKRYDYEVERRVGSSKKLFEITGHKPKTLIREGLEAIYKTKYLTQV